jgi:hypothetical protein
MRPERINLPEVPAVLELWTPAEATELLRLHAEVGGAGVANLMEALGQDVRWWLLEFRPGWLVARAHAGRGRRLFEVAVPYGRILDVVCRRCRELVEGRGLVHCHLPQGQRTVVCGRTTGEALEAINLLWVAATRTLPALANGAAPPLVLRNEDLALLLLQRYGDQAQVIAEAIRALRKVPGKLDAWIVQVLEGSPVLKELATAVRRELHGDRAEQL